MYMIKKSVVHEKHEKGGVQGNKEVISSAYPVTDLSVIVIHKLGMNTGMARM
jgi:hypothetical protein